MAMVLLYVSATSAVHHGYGQLPFIVLPKFIHRMDHMLMFWHNIRFMIWASEPIHKYCAVFLTNNSRN